MCTHDLCFEQIYEKLLIFHLKITIFTAVKNHSILHGRVFVICSSFRLYAQSKGTPHMMTILMPSALCFTRSGKVNK